MGMMDKAKNSAEDAGGEAKDKLGDATDDKDLQAEGKTDQGKAKAKKTGESVKDALS